MLDLPSMLRSPTLIPTKSDKNAALLRFSEVLNEDQPMKLIYYMIFFCVKNERLK